MQNSLLQTVQTLPEEAGVYQYYNSNKQLLYVGKAKNLKKRLKSYWRFRPHFHPNPSLNRRILCMLRQATSLKYIVLDNEIDALILENSLIKELNPKYNILLRDDKTYPYIYLDRNQKYPRFELTRKVIKKKNISYYGPFPQGAKILLKSIYELFSLVQKKTCLQGKKACLFYQIKKCSAPCEEKITKEAYNSIVLKAQDSILKPKNLIEALHTKMVNLATAERFEEARELRDNIETLKALSTGSHLDLKSNDNIDLFAIINNSPKGVIVKFFIREGKVISSSFSTFQSRDFFDLNEAYKQTILEFYNKKIPQIPKTILVADSFYDQKELSQLLKKRFSQQIKITHPKQGEKFKLIQLALKNANEFLKKRANNEALIEEKIAELFELNIIPSRVESFDNSHIMGVATVGAMVVYSEDEWITKDYRHYSLNSGDEYGQMREMLTRRVENFSKNSMPDLWILDGGETLRKLAVKLLKNANIELDVIAIAKEKIDGKAHRAKGYAKDIIYTHQSVFTLLPSDKRLQWVQKQRDEAHRTALKYHQKKKRQEDTRSRLLEKKGIGLATVKKLINYFGTFQAIENATYNEISVASSEKIAKILKT